VAQEALNDVLDNGTASRCDVTLEHNGMTVALYLAYDAPTATPAPPSIALNVLRIRERLAAWNGRVARLAVCRYHNHPCRGLRPPRMTRSPLWGTAVRWLGRWCRLERCPSYLHWWIHHGAKPDPAGPRYDGKLCRGAVARGEVVAERQCEICSYRPAATLSHDLTESQLDGRACIRCCAEDQPRRPVEAWRRLSSQLVECVDTETCTERQAHHVPRA
jgi:hypothetical protein